MLRKIEFFVYLSEVWAHLGPYYSDVGRPSIDPELMIRMLIVGYCFGIRSERRLCEEVHLDLAYRWFCRLGLDADVPDHSTFSKNRHGRFRESDLLRKQFKTVVARCMKEGIVGGEAFAVDASMIVADTHRRRGGQQGRRPRSDLKPRGREYLSVLDHRPSAGRRRSSRRRFRRPIQRPATQPQPTSGGLRLFRQLPYRSQACGDHGRRGDDGRSPSGSPSGQKMLDRTAEQFEVAPSRLVADAGYGSAEMVGWLVDEREIEPHVKLMDKSERTDGTLSRSDFAFDPVGNRYVCPGGKELRNIIACSPSHAVHCLPISASTTKDSSPEPASAGGTSVRRRSSRPVSGS